MRKYVVRFMVFYILSIGCLLGIIIYSYQNKIDRHNEQVEIEYPGVWKLSDEYDNRNSSYMEFLHQKNSLSILKNVYKEYIQSSDENDLIKRMKLKTILQKFLIFFSVICTILAIWFGVLWYSYMQDAKNSIIYEIETTISDN